MEVNAYVQGRVAEVLPAEGVVVETEASFIQGIFGVGGETHGEIAVVSERPDEELPAARLGERHRGKVWVESQPGELLRQKAATATDVQGPAPDRCSRRTPIEHAAEVGEPARREAALQDVERVVLVPPARAQAVVDVVVDRHRHLLARMPHAQPTDAGPRRRAVLRQAEGGGVKKPPSQ